MDGLDLNRIVGSSATISDKIRTLAAAGCSRADIARSLNKRYQYVRNVLEADKVRAANSTLTPGVSETSRQFNDGNTYRTPDVEDRGGGAYRLEIRKDGSVVVPEAVRLAMGVAPGRPLMAKFDGDELRLISGETAIRRVQELLRPLYVEGVSWADELIAERRREVAREDSDG